MILQLHNYPVDINGDQRGANNPVEYELVARLLRQVLLNESDWLMVSDSPLSDEVRQEWVIWRQAMRDLPSAFPAEMPGTFVIPEPPVAYRPASWINVTPDAPWMNVSTHTHEDGTTHTH